MNRVCFDGRRHYWVTLHSVKLLNATHVRIPYIFRSNRQVVAIPGGILKLKEPLHFQAGDQWSGLALGMCERSFRLDLCDEDHCFEFHAQGDCLPISYFDVARVIKWKSNATFI